MDVRLGRLRFVRGLHGADHEEVHRLHEQLPRPAVRERLSVGLGAGVLRPPGPMAETTVSKASSGPTSRDAMPQARSLGGVSRISGGMISPN